MAADEPRGSPTELAVLIVEDAEADALLLLRELRNQGFAVRHRVVDNAEAMTEALAAASWDVVLCDYALPQFNGLDALKLAHDHAPDLPFIIVSGAVGEETAVAAMRAGAHDYLMKGNLTRLGEAIRRELHAAQERRARRQAGAHLRHLNRVLRAIRNVNQLIVKERDPDRLLQRACELLIETRGYVGAWMVRGGGAGAPQGVAGAGWDEPFATFTTRLRSGWQPPCAARLGGPEEVTRLSPSRHCEGCPLWHSYRFDAAACVALRHDETTYGMMAVALPDAAALDPDEELLLLEIAGDLAFALHDIHSEQRRHRSEQFLLDMGRMARVGGWEVEAASRTVRWTTVTREIHEVADDFVPELDEAIAFFHPDDVPRLTAAIGAALERAEPYDLEIRLITARGREVWTHTRCRPVVEDGHVVRLVGTYQDISALKQAEAERAKSERLLRHITDQMLDMVALCDAEGRFTYTSLASRQLGYEPDELVGKRVEEFVHPDDRERVLGEIALAVQTGQPHQAEYRYRRGDGQYAWLDTRGKLLTDEKGQPMGLILCTRDVTERRQLETQLAQSDRLSSMGMLAAGVAHEINNPLSYVLYNLESLREDLPELLAGVRATQARLEAHLGAERLAAITGKADQSMNPALLNDMVERFTDALDGSRRIREIARGLSTFSRVEQDQLVPVNLRHVIEVAINMAFNELKYRARLVKDYGRTPLVVASEGRLSQVFLNLLINAAHAIEEGDVEHNEVRIRTWSEGDEVCAEVHDTGKGIAPHELAQVFEPFFTTKRLGVGSGLGLAITRSIVEGYGGTITVASELGGGSSFVLRLPVQAPQEVTVASSAPPPEDSPRGRILLVDDEAGIRDAMVRMLRDHDTTVAASGAEAQQLLRQDQGFDVIVCDMMMPQMSGMDLHRWLTRRHPQLAERLVFITGGAFTPKARQYLTEVDNLRLEKPLDAANFKKIVGRLVRSGRGDGDG